MIFICRSASSRVLKATGPTRTQASSCGSFSMILHFLVVFSPARHNNRRLQARTPNGTRVGSSKSFLLSMGPAIRACRQLQATAAGEVEGGAVSRLASLFAGGSLERPAYQIIDFQPVTHRTMLAPYSSVTRTTKASLRDSRCSGSRAFQTCDDGAAATHGLHSAR